MPNTSDRNSAFFFYKRLIDIKDEQEQEGLEGLTVKAFPDCKVLVELVYLIYQQKQENATLNNEKNTNPS